jgi:hypothetical protein
VIKVDGVHCYCGAFWSPVSPIATELPVIYSYALDQRMVRIELGYPPSGPHFGPDSRNSLKLLAELARLQKAQVILATQSAGEGAFVSVIRAQKRGALLLQIVDFYQRDASTLIFSGDNRGVGAGDKSGENRGFTRVGWRTPSRENFTGLVLLPIVVLRDGVAVAIVDAQDWILERASDAVLRERRADGADDNLRRPSLRNDESADHDLVACTNFATSTNPSPPPGLKPVGRGGRADASCNGITTAKPFNRDVARQGKVVTGGLFQLD